MVILPVNGTVLVQQGNKDFKKLYEESFPDTTDGLKSAYRWAFEIAMGWHDCQTEEWKKNHAA